MAMKGTCFMRLIVVVLAFIGLLYCDREDTESKENAVETNNDVASDTSQKNDTAEESESETGGVENDNDRVSDDQGTAPERGSDDGSDVGSDDGSDASGDAGNDDGGDDGGDDSAVEDTDQSDCGDAGQMCCARDVCNGRACCVGNQCVAEGDSCGESWGACNDGACEACGGPEQECCDDACQRGFACVDFVIFTRCDPCGGDGEICCPEIGCDDGVCIDFGFGLVTCQVECGAPDQKCCTSGLRFGDNRGVCEAGVTCNNEGMCGDDARSPDDGDSTIIVRARGTTGTEHINLRVGNDEIADWILTTAYEDYEYTTSASGNITVEFDNDQGGSDDVQVDYISVNGQIRQAESQANNTAAWANGTCGAGAFTEWMHCNGVIDFGAVN